MLDLLVNIALHFRGLVANPFPVFRSPLSRFAYCVSQIAHLTGYCSVEQRFPQYNGGGGHVFAGGQQQGGYYQQPAYRGGNY
jgi:hypothetical protein